MLCACVCGSLHRPIDKGARGHEVGQHAAKAHKNVVHHGAADLLLDGHPRARCAAFRLPARPIPLQPHCLCCLDRRPCIAARAQATAWPCKRVRATEHSRTSKFSRACGARSRFALRGSRWQRAAARFFRFSPYCAHAMSTAWGSKWTLFFLLHHCVDLHELCPHAKPRKSSHGGSIFSRPLTDKLAPGHEHP